MGTVDVIQAAQVRPRPFRRAFAAASILPVVFAVSGLITSGVEDSHALGRVFGYMLTMTAIPGLLGGLLAWRSRTGWRWWKHLLVVIPVQLVLFLMDLGGRAMR